jgi:hypothetical protein
MIFFLYEGNINCRGCMLKPDQIIPGRCNVALAVRQNAKQRYALYVKQ